jgi:hypothetical protein
MMKCIISSAEYLHKLSWIVPQGLEHEMNRVWFPRVAKFTTHETASSLTQDDVAKYYQEIGYVMEELKSSIHGVILQDNKPAMPFSPWSATS